MKKLVMLLLAVFCLGWIANSLVSSFNAEEITPAVDLEGVTTLSAPTSVVSGKNQSALLEQFEKIEKLVSPGSSDKEKPSPQDRVKQEQILVYDDQVIINIDNPEWAVFTDTNSMDPVIDAGANAIEIVPKSEEEIEVGDIVAYRSKYQEGVIAHRVVEVGSDSNGWYARMKGDNNERMDPGKVRFDQIERVLVAIIY